MIGRLNHVAIAVKDMASAAATYRDTLGAKVSEAVEQPEHGVSTVFIELPNTKIELLEPLGENSPIAKFLERNPDGGIHHLCYEVDDIRAAREALTRGRRPGARRRRAQDRRPRQAGAVPSPEGLQRHAGRTRRSVRQADLMTLTSGIAVYFILWWLVFFIVLPFGVQTQEGDEAMVEGTSPSAPRRPLLLRKALITTVLAALVFWGLYELIVVVGIGLDDFPFLPDVRPEDWQPNYATGNGQ